MDRVFGEKELFAPIRREHNRYIICYDYQEEQDEEHATWTEITLYRKQTPVLNFDIVKKAIIDDINGDTDNKILTGFVWTALEGEDAGEQLPVYLSQENEFNFKAAYDIAVQTNGANLPVTFKLSEDHDGTPVYHTFTSMEESTDFYLKAVGYINQCLAEGWRLKDSIDWQTYRDALEQ